MRIQLKSFMIIIAGVAILAGGTGWYLVQNPDRFIPKLSAYLQKQIGSKVLIKHIVIKVFPTLTAQIYGLEIRNSKPFPSGDLLSVPRLDATLEMLPLFYGRIAIKSLLLHKPTIDVISDPDGLWNFQNPNGSQKASDQFSITMIPNLRIENGVLRGSNLIDPSDRPGPVVLDLENFSAQIDQTSHEPSSDHPRSAGLVGRLAADTGRFGSIHTKNPHSKLYLTSKELDFSNLETDIYNGIASGNFSLRFGQKNTMLKTDLQINSIGMPYLLADFIKGAPAMTGVMKAKLSLGGEIAHTSSPLADIHGHAHVTIQKGEMPKLDENKSMVAMERFRPSGTAAFPASAFSTLSADMELRNNRIYSQRIAVDFYGTEVVGSGSASVLNGSLEYQGDATVLMKQGLITNLYARFFKEAQDKNGRLTFPLRLKGTITSPTLSVIE